MSTDLEGETLLTTQSSESVDAPVAVPTLTILAHPDPLRVGDVLSLRTLSAGQPILLSRVEPAFSGRVDGSERDSKTVGGPLGGRFLSRQPIRLGPAEDGGLRIDRSTARTAVEVNGEPLDTERTVSAQEIAAGTVLTLARKIVLLLHLEPSPSSEASEGPSFGLVGGGAAMGRLRQEIVKLAPLDVPVLLRGETGTGKELVARALHDAGPRQKGPFVAVNMAVLGPSLAAAALFGAERGAYTGADRKRSGHFQSACGGTLFLDEIGEAPPEVQAMLLRALETRQVQPVGSNVHVDVDVRVVAATDARLEEAMAEGRFKMPLYHRLGGYTLHLPALRQRREDIGRLFTFFLNEELAQLVQPPLEAGDRPWPPAEVVARLARHTWPGNVRELRNVVRRLAIAGPNEPVPDLEPLLLPTAGTHSSALGLVTGPIVPKPSKRRTLRKLEDVDEAELLDALREHRWEIQKTAEALKVSRPNLYRLMEMSSSVRPAHQLGQDEIEAAVAAVEGDLEAAAFRLEVSVLGLKRRMKALGMSLG